MCKKLILVFFLIFSGAIGAQEIPLRFKTIDEAKKWLDPKYQRIQVEKYKLTKNKYDFYVYGVYGFRGSGIERVNGWFFMCFENKGCDLLGVMNFGDGRLLKDDPRVYIEGKYLIVKQDETLIIRFNLAEN